MAVRSPTAFTQYIDDSQLNQRQFVRTTQPSNVVDDQHFAALKNEMILSDMFFPMSVTAAAWQDVARYYVRLDYCGARSSPAATKWSILCRASALQDFDVAVYAVGSATRWTYTVTATHTTWSWRAWQAGTLVCTGLEETLIVQARRNVGTPTIYIGGVALFTDV